jgi:hypothetical protein
LRCPITQGETIIITDYKGFARGNDCLDHPELKTRQKTHTDTFSSIQISKKFLIGFKVEKILLGKNCREMWAIDGGVESSVVNRGNGGMIGRV